MPPRPVIVLSELFRVALVRFFDAGLDFFHMRHNGHHQLFHVVGDAACWQFVLVHVEGNVPLQFLCFLYALFASS